jgi:hypothetical protein
LKRFDKVCQPLIMLIKESVKYQTAMKKTA